MDLSVHRVQTELQMKTKYGSAPAPPCSQNYTLSNLLFCSPHLKTNTTGVPGQEKRATSAIIKWSMRLTHGGGGGVGGVYEAPAVLHLKAIIRHHHKHTKRLREAFSSSITHQTINAATTGGALVRFITFIYIRQQPKQKSVSKIPGTGFSPQLISISRQTTKPNKRQKYPLMNTST